MLITKTSLIIHALLQFALTILGFQEMISKWNVLYPRVFTVEDICCLKIEHWILCPEEQHLDFKTLM